MKQFNVGKNESGLRFDKYLKKILKEAPDSFIYKMLRKKNITLNGKRSSGNEKVNEGDIVRLFLSDETFDKFSGHSDLRFAYLDDEDLIHGYSEFFSSGIIYEDEDRIIYNKPAGMLSQKSEVSDVSVNEYLIAYLFEKDKVNKEGLKTFVPSACNRLDRNTTGIILCSKSLEGARTLSDALHDRTIHKEYRAVVHGDPSFETDDETVIEGYIKRDKNEKISFVSSDDDSFDDYIKTGFKKIRTFKNKDGIFSVLSVVLYTGKTHQIRSQLSALGFPIAGDVKYDPEHKKHLETISRYPRHQLLHAYKVIFPEGEEFIADPDDEYAGFINRLYNNGNLEEQRA